MLIIFLIYRHKHLEYNSADNDFSVEMDDGALNILETNIDTQDAYIHSNQSDIAENPFMKDDFIESNNASDINDNFDSNNVDDSQVSESNSE
ncbi:hypothetical protein TRFO_13981 [Tritrichomonas foetus]|uniref:Uncharacterized protein n=1 Tax=Tritrichomonas foetus TaxID=1144522 RepID=A0A1J4KWT1_9EUKA|nr:hypothetical protein TRFO_13975 [Tritrichomonas foetus]OHT15626.1 hypothetical protein TRFO_13981 [Tritrichomonas foetus]|eukprot:OHT15624.1 hypothetical protein TRFO_13975 [Tritrichomonas foetus]